MLLNFKKLFLPSLFFFAIAGFISGCIFESKEVSPIQDFPEMVYETKIGILKFLDQQEAGHPRATHYLILDENKLILIGSNIVDLNTSEYLNKKVKVRGLFAEGGELEKDFIDVEQIEVISDALEELVPENRFLNYVSKNLGISFQYKGVFQIRENFDLIELIPIEELNLNKIDFSEKISIKILPNEKKQTLSDWLKNIKNIAKTDQIAAKIGEQKMDAIKVVNDDETIVDFYTANDQFIYQLTHKSTGGEQKDLFRNYFYEMLHTFNLSEKPIVALKDLSNPAKTDDVKTIPSESKPEKIESQEQPEDNKSDISLEEDKEADDSSAQKITESEPKLNDDTLEKVNDSNITNADYESVVAYIQANIMELAPEKPESGLWRTTGFEFVEPDYVYTEYNSGVEIRKILLQYEVLSATVQIKLIGYFKPGEDKDWVTASGANPAAGKSREVVTIDESGSLEKNVTVQEGYRSLESVTYGFSLQYPVNWYYDGTKGGGRYGFSDTPSGEGQELIVLDIIKENIDNYSKGSSLNFGSKKAFKVLEGDIVNIYVERVKGGSYRLSGGSEFDSFISVMAGSIRD